VEPKRVHQTDAVLSPCAPFMYLLRPLNSPLQAKRWKCLLGPAAVPVIGPRPRPPITIGQRLSFAFFQLRNDAPTRILLARLFLERLVCRADGP
jgi:hypothetical protein